MVTLTVRLTVRYKFCGTSHNFVANFRTRRAARDKGRFPADSNPLSEEVLIVKEIPEKSVQET